MNINEVIQQETDKLIAEKLPEIVNQKAAKLLDDIVGDLFRSYSDTGKQIKEQIERSLDINLARFGMVDYNAMVGKATNDRLIGLVNDQGIQPIMSMVHETIGFLDRKEYKLSEIQELVFATARENADWDERYGTILFEIQENELDARFGHKTVAVGLKKDAAETLEFSFHVRKARQKSTIFSFRTGYKYSNANTRTSVDSPRKLAGLTQLEHRLFRLYAAQVEIIDDSDDIDFDNDWSNED